jgi:hypothetical protein
MSGRRAAALGAPAQGGEAGARATGRQAQLSQERRRQQARDLLWFEAIGPTPAQRLPQSRRMFGEPPGAQSALVHIAFAQDERSPTPVRRPRCLGHAPFADPPGQDAVGGVEELRRLVVVLNNEDHDRWFAERLVARQRNRPAVEQRVVAAEPLIVDGDSSTGASLRTRGPNAAGAPMTARDGGAP